MNWVKALSLSPMVVGIVLGMLYANSLRNNRLTRGYRVSAFVVSVYCD